MTKNKSLFVVGLVFASFLIAASSRASGARWDARSYMAVHGHHPPDGRRNPLNRTPSGSRVVSHRLAQRARVQAPVSAVSGSGGGGRAGTGRPFALQLRLMNVHPPAARAGALFRRFCR